MEAFEYKSGKCIVLELRGRVDEFNTSILRDELSTILNTGKFRIAIDLSKTNFVSAHCLRAVWSMSQKAQKHNGLIVISGATGQVEETIRYVQLEKVIPCVETVQGALAILEHYRNHQVPESSGNHTPGVLGKLYKFLSRFAAVLLLSLFLPMDTLNAQEITSFTLDEVLAKARETSGQIRLARLRMSEKSAEVQIAKSAAMPKMVGTLGYLYQSNPGIVGDVINRELAGLRNPPNENELENLKTRSNVSFDNNITLVSLGFAQVVYSGGLLDSQTDLKLAQKSEADAQFTMQSTQIEEQIRNAYVGLLLTQKKLELIQAQQRALKARFDAMSRAREAKTISELRFAEIEVLMLKSEQDKIEAEREERSLRGLLNIALGRSVDAAFVPAQQNLALLSDLQSAEHYFEIAVHRYPELRKTMALIDTAAAYQKIAKSQSLFVPTAAVFGTLDHVRGVGDNQGMSWTLGVGLVFPLVDGGRSFAEFEKATSLASQARIAHEETEKKLLIEINEVLSKIKQSKIQLELAQKTEDIAGKRREESSRAIEEGQLPQYRLAEAEAAEIEAKMAIIGAQSELYRWQSRLLALTGQEQF